MITSAGSIVFVIMQACWLVCSLCTLWFFEKNELDFRDTWHIFCQISRGECWSFAVTPLQLSHDLWISSLNYAVRQILGDGINFGINCDFWQISRWGLERGIHSLNALYYVIVSGESLAADFLSAHHVVPDLASVVLQSIRMPRCLGDHCLRAPGLSSTCEVQT